MLYVQLIVVFYSDNEKTTCVNVYEDEMFYVF